MWCYVGSLKWAILVSSHLVFGGMKDVLRFRTFHAKTGKVSGKLDQSSYTVSRGRSVYTTELGKSYKSEHCLLRELLVKYAPAHCYARFGSPALLPFICMVNIALVTGSSPYSSSLNLRDCAAVIGRGEDLRSYPFSWKCKPLLGKLCSNNPSIMNHIDKALENLKLRDAFSPDFMFSSKSMVYFCDVYLFIYWTKSKLFPNGYI